MNSDKKKCPNIMIVAPDPPPYGGMANQAQLLERYLLAQGAVVLMVPTNRSIPLLDSRIDKIFGVRTLIREIFFLYRTMAGVLRSDVIHVLACSHMYFFLNVLPSILMGKLFRKSVVVNYRGGEAKVFFSRINKFFLRLLCKADRITVPGTYLNEVFDGFGIKTSIVPNIVELDRFAFRVPEKNITPIFVSTRNFEDYYDIPTAIRAFKNVTESLPRARLRLIGDGSRKNEIKDLIKTLGIDGSVEMVGRIDPEDMPGYLADSDIFINSSVVDNYPNSILEAFAAGLPVITTGAGGIPHLVKNGVNGIITEPGDWNGLGRAMLHLAEDHDLRRVLSKGGKAMADKHAWESIWPLLYRQYNCSGK